MMAAKWLRFALVCFVIASPFIRAEDADDSQTSKKQEDPDKPWFVESINVTITDGPSAEELVAKREQENLNSTDHARNTTSSDNSTNAEPRQPKWLCSGREMPENTSNTVLITDDVVALNWINGTVANATGRCTLVLFYARFCTFCANMAPLYNALGRVVSDIPIIALDAYTHTSLNARFGVVSVPTIVLFYNGKPVLKFNNTKTLEALKTFLTNNTGLTIDPAVEVSEQDYGGPLSNKPEHYTDYHLIFSALFLFAFGLHLFVQSQYCVALWNRLQGVSWSRLPVLNLFIKEKRD